jgi:septal ring factor EnvC (AmiA/AmiB activator)
MSDETDRTIARLRDELRAAHTQIDKLRELRDSLTDTIAHLIEKERAMQKELDEGRAVIARASGAV